MTFFSFLHSNLAHGNKEFIGTENESTTIWTSSRNGRNGVWILPMTCDWKWNLQRVAIKLYSMLFYIFRRQFSENLPLCKKRLLWPIDKPINRLTDQKNEQCTKEMAACIHHNDDLIFISSIYSCYSRGVPIKLSIAQPVGGGNKIKGFGDGEENQKFEKKKKEIFWRSTI